MSHDIESKEQPPSAPSWSSLPQKGQLAIIASVRVVDFFQVASLQAFMFHQIQSFAPSAPDSEISFQTGVLQGVFTSAQIFTGIIWGMVADAPWAGRKTVLLIGLIGTGISCVGLAFARSFAVAVAWRCLGGAINGTVGAARTTLAETVEKKYHSRAFLLLPMAFNIANIFGPILGGLLADPVAAYPTLFGQNSAFGGSDGVGWLIRYPYAAPNLLSAVLLFADAVLIWLGLRETQHGKMYSPDRGLELGESIKYCLHRIISNRFGYSPLGQYEESHTSSEDLPMHPLPATELTQTSQTSKDLPSRPLLAVLTNPNVLLVLLTTALFDFQMGGFASLWLVFLSSSYRHPKIDLISLPFHFTGGLFFSPSTLGVAMSLLGILGIILQLTFYPSVNSRFGLLRSTRFSLFIFPLAYALAPYLSLLVDTPFAMWLGITLVLLLQVGARTFALPGTILLINNSSPDPGLLGTVHGLGASTSSAFRTIGPIVTGYWYGVGLERGMVGLSWWALAAVSVAGWVVSFGTKEGS